MLTGFSEGGTVAVLQDQHPYRVTLEDFKGREFVETIAEYSHVRAAKTAALMHPESRVLRVSGEWEPIGTCAACGIVVFAGGTERVKRGSLRCGDCGPDCRA